MEKSQRKFKTRELTKNEKVLLSLLAIIVLFWLAYRFIYIPQQEKLEYLNSERQNYEEKIQEINSTLRKEEAINKEWKDLHEEKEKIVSGYFPTLDQAQIIYILNELIEKDNISIPDLNFNQPDYSDLGGFEVKSMDISIPYSGNYDGVISVLNSIKKSPRKILVDNLFMDKAMNEDLNGSMSLKIYSLDGIAESEKDVVYIDIASKEEKDNPFITYDDYEEYAVNDEDFQESEVKPYIEEMLLDFESNNSYFIPSQSLVKGNISLSTKAKSNKHSLKLEYNIIGIEEENRAYIDVTRNNILIKYPPNTIGLWVYSYDYSLGTLGLGLKGQMGEEILVPLTEGIGWTGWKYIETSPPNELSIYPLTLESLYIEMPEGREDYGIILFDKLEAVYNRNLGEDGSDMSISEYIFHVVEKGDTIEGISQMHYGSKKYKDEILKLNEINIEDMLQVGKVLVLKKR